MGIGGYVRALAVAAAYGIGGITPGLFPSAVGGDIGGAACAAGCCGECINIRPMHMSLINRAACRHASTGPRKNTIVGTVARSCREPLWWIWVDSFDAF